MGKSILERDLTNVNNVARPLAGTLTFLDITASILEKNLTNVRNVARPLATSQHLPSQNAQWRETLQMQGM